MKMFRMLVNMLFTTANAQMLVGSQRDDHGCVLDGGYQWCDYTQSCVRLWEEGCPEPAIDPPRVCNECRPIPCARPYFPDTRNCRMVTDTDSCGCQTSCPHYDCRNTECQSDSDCRSNEFCRPTGNRYPMVNGRRLQLASSECVEKSGINETCGGYTPPEFQTRCLDGLECVNTMGPMIADAPGQCREPCQDNELRNQYGDCVVQQTTIPDGCASWFDGCNTCSVRNGRIEMCTLMYCFTNSPTRCMSYYRDSSLNVGSVCYRFCENGSQDFVDRKGDCPSNTVCSAPSNDMIGFDSCGDSAWTCQNIGH